MLTRSDALPKVLFVVISLVFVSRAFAAPTGGENITKEELLPLLCKTDVTVIDLRFGRDWYGSNIKIKCAVREDPLKPGQWMDKYPKDKMLILYCD